MKNVLFSTISTAWMKIKISSIQFRIENFQNLRNSIRNIRIRFPGIVELLVKARKQRVNGKGDLEQKKDCRGIEFSRGTKRRDTERDRWNSGWCVKRVQNDPARSRGQSRPPFHVWVSRRPGIKLHLEFFARSRLSRPLSARKRAKDEVGSRRVVWPTWHFAQGSVSRRHLYNLEGEGETACTRRSS